MGVACSGVGLATVVGRLALARATLAGALAHGNSNGRKGTPGGAWTAIVSQDARAAGRRGGAHERRATPGRAAGSSQRKASYIGTFGVAPKDWLVWATSH